MMLDESTGRLNIVGILKKPNDQESMLNTTENILETSALSSPIHQKQVKLYD
jgi:hypothetical protein